MTIIYPKIPWYGKDTPNSQCIAFEKYDGTNLSLEWNKQTGFGNIRTRKNEIDDFFKDAIPLFENYKEILEKIFRDKFKQDNQVIVWTEYFGKHSFAGLHQPEDPKQLIFLDAWTPTYGFLNTKTFLTNFEQLPLPKIIYQGKLTGNFAQKVKDNYYNVEEGVICKGNNWCCKIKTTRWMNKLEESFKNKKWEPADKIYREIKEELNNE